MNNCENRPQEIAYLLNPAFCGRLIYTVVRQYNLISNQSFLFPLIYLILPPILHRKTREKISSRVKLLNWIRQNPDLLIGFAQRTSNLIEITNEAIELLLQTGIIKVTNNAELEVNSMIKGLSKTKFVDDEIKDCLKKSEYVGKWFANTGKVETIYIGLVRP